MATKPTRKITNLGVSVRSVPSPGGATRRGPREPASASTARIGTNEHDQQQHPYRPEPGPPKITSPVIMFAIATAAPRPVNDSTLPA